MNQWIGNIPSLYPNSVCHSVLLWLTLQSRGGGGNSPEPQVPFHESFTKVALQTWKVLGALPLQVVPTDHCNLFCHSSGVYNIMCVCMCALVFMFVYCIVQVWSCIICSCVSAYLLFIYILNNMHLMSQANDLAFPLSDFVQTASVSWWWIQRQLQSSCHPSLCCMMSP